MNSSKTIDTFFDKLKEMHGIAELNRHLLYMLLEMQSGLTDSVQKFLCLCFSLWDDGNTRIPLEPTLFTEMWNKKWDSLTTLKKSTTDSFDDSDADFADFGQIISEGIAFINNANTNAGKGISEIIAKKISSDKINEKETLQPLVMAQDKGKAPYLYMAKYFKAKSIIEESIQKLFKDGSANRPTTKDIENCIGNVAKIAKLPNGKPLELNEEQATAILRGQNENLLITGGPGTGKTTVVLYILWNLLAKKSDMLDYSIYLAAPSGKAADRMQESLQKGLKGIGDEFKYEMAPATGLRRETEAYKKLKNLEGSTIHRLLKFSRYSNGFTYNANDQFSEKSIFVIDEASMIDVNLFASLLQAIPENARIFILGDPYQLPSVDAGAVLGEILQPKSKKDFTVKLIKSNRFTDDSVIGKLAKEIKDCVENGAAPVPHEFVPHPALSTSLSVDAPTSQAEAKDKVFYYTLEEQGSGLEKVLKAWVGNFANLPLLASRIDPKELDPEKCNEIWELSLTKRILTAERQGYQGTEQINKAICKLIGSNYKGSPYFPGQLLIITKNQEMYKLYNGDTGIVVFEGSTPYIMLKKANDFVAYPLALLPADAIETAFAITIHKSQGSEYDHVTVFLPKQEGHPLLNNQILYTGITRAKQVVEIIATPETFKAACKTVIKRDTGIAI